jgi:hypothetical protein
MPVGFCENKKPCIKVEIMCNYYVPQAGLWKSLTKINHPYRHPELVSGSHGDK